MHSILVRFTFKNFCCHASSRVSYTLYTQSGGVFWTKGEITILGGVFDGNKASEKGGGVFYVDQEEGTSSIVIQNGTFIRNTAEEDGGVGIVTEDATLYVYGGTYSENIAFNGGGVFAAQDGGYFEASEKPAIIIC